MDDDPSSDYSPPSSSSNDVAAESAGPMTPQKRVAKTASRTPKVRRFFDAHDSLSNVSSTEHEEGMVG